MAGMTTFNVQTHLHTEPAGRQMTSTLRLHDSAFILPQETDRSIGSVRFSPQDIGDSCPPCLPEAFKTMGHAARVILAALARHLKLRSE